MENLLTRLFLSSSSLPFPFHISSYPGSYFQILTRDLFRNSDTACASIGREDLLLLLRNLVGVEEDTIEVWGNVNIVIF
jgi:hypothetical protein